MLGRGLGHDPRRRDGGHRLRRTWCSPTSAPRPTRGASPGSRRTPRWRSTPYSAPEHRAALRADVGAGPARAAAGRRAGQRPPADLRPRRTPPPRTATPALADLERPARRLAGRRGPRGRPGPALGARSPRSPRPAASARPDRRRARARQHHLRPGEGRRRPGRAARPPRPRPRAGGRSLDRGTPNETAAQMVFSIFRYGQDDVLAPYVEQYLEAADTVSDTLGFHKGSVVLEYGFPKALGSPELLERVDAWLAGTDGTRAPCATSARAAPTSPAPSPPRPGTPRPEQTPSRRQCSPLRRALAPTRRSQRQSACRVSGARAWSASIWMPRRRPPTRSPSANDDCICSVVSSTSWSVRLRRTTAAGDDLEHPGGRVDHDQDAARRGDQRVVQLGREGARRPPSTRPTKTLNSKRETCSARRIASSIWNRSALLNSPTPTCATRLRLVGVRARAARRCPCAGRRTTGPAVAWPPGVNRSPLTTPGITTSSGDHHEQQQRDADEQQHRLDRVDVGRGRSSPPARPRWPDRRRRRRAPPRARTTEVRRTRWASFVVTGEAYRVDRSHARGTGPSAVHGCPVR